MRNISKALLLVIGGGILLAIGVLFIAYVLASFNVDIRPVLAVAIALSPIWLPVLLFTLAFEEWMDFVHEKFKFKNGRTTLRIKLPQEVLKSPEAMESIFAQINSPNFGDNVMQTFLDGKHPLVSSFELVSIGGDVRFYVNVPTAKVRNMIEAQFYAQYPGIEVFEEPIDYTAEVVWDPRRWELMSFHLLKKDKAIFPIKTYIDFKHDLQPKEELKYEPMAPLIEHLGKARPHERLWVQILVLPHRAEALKSGSLSKTKTWEADAKAEIDKLMKRDKPDDDAKNDRATLTPAERDKVLAIERNAGKYAYNVAIRAMYIAQTGKFDGEMIGPMVRSFSAYDILGRNRIGVIWRTDFDYPFFADFSGDRRTAMKKKELEAYKMRSYKAMAKDKADAMKTMSSEELATIYHIPGTSVVTPGLGRIETTRREAPTNLPIGNLPL